MSGAAAVPEGSESELAGGGFEVAAEEVAPGESSAVVAGARPGKYDILPGWSRTRFAMSGILEGAAKAILALSSGHQHG